MRAKNKIYHIDCFRCVACSRQLIPGDEFALRDDGLFCKADHDVVERAQSNGSGSTNGTTTGNTENNNNNINAQNNNNNETKGDIKGQIISSGKGKKSAYNSFSTVFFILSF